jgi:hypothetical protein
MKERTCIHTTAGAGYENRTTTLVVLSGPVACGKTTLADLFPNAAILDRGSDMLQPRAQFVKRLRLALRRNQLVILCTKFSESLPDLNLFGALSRKQWASTNILAWKLERL